MAVVYGSGVQVGTSGKVPSLTQAIRATLTVIERRARQHRNLVIAMVVVFFAVVLSALLLWSWWPLLGWVGFVPLVGTHLLFDCLRVHRWLGDLVRLFYREAFQVGLLIEAMQMNPKVPQSTLAGMLVMLTGIQKQLEESASDEAEPALLAAVDASNRHQMIGILLGTVCATGLLAFAVLAAVYRVMPFFIGLAISAMLWFLVRRFR